jgi:histidine triad (HIT) family protein
MLDCVFCNIIQKTIHGSIIFEDDQMVVIQDILPKAPVHLLVLPKKHIASLIDVTAADQALLGAMILKAKQFAEEHHIADSGYKLLFNVGKHGGQTVKHLHLHLLGGKQLAEIE